MFVSAAVSAALVHLLRRLTPLVALLNMSLVFPDSVPSRFGLALRTGTVKRLMAEPALRLSSSAQAAAEEALLLISHLGKHDAQTRGHTERVRAYADVIGQQMGLSEAELNGLRWGTLLHDVGKLSVPAEILNKPGKPTAEEWEILRGHPEAAIPILEPLQGWLGEWLLAASQHHEKWDGSGYPNGLSGNEISLAGRIAAVADAYDVITSRRSYKEAMSSEAARSEMVKSAGTHFDPMVVRSLLEASVNKSGYTRRMGWILELPGVASTFSTAGHAIGASVASIMIATAATLSGTTPLDEQPPESLAFIASVIPREEAVATGGNDVIAAGATGQRASESTVPLAADSSVPPPLPALDDEATVVAANPTTTVPPVDTAQPIELSDGPPTTAAPATTVAATRAPVPTTTVAPATTVAATRAPVPTTTVAPTLGPAPADAADCRTAQSGERVLVGLDLRRCDLSSLSGAGFDFTFADLGGADLSNVVLTDFNFSNANFEGANLEGAQLTRGSAVLSSFIDASMRGSSITEVNFFQSDLRRSDFRNTQLSGVSFSEANVRQVDFTGATVSATNFISADAVSANFSGVNLSGIEFFSAKVSQVSFSAANLTDAKFADATGIPTSNAQTTFFQTTCPVGDVLNTSCWAG